MAKQSDDAELPKINMKTFIAGEAVDLKNGVPGSVFSSLGMNFRDKASQATVLPGFKNIAGNSQLSDLPLAFEQDLNGIRYACGDAGYVYEINNSNVVSQLGQLGEAGGAGLEYSPQNDNLFISGQQSVSLFGQCTQNSPQLLPGHFGASASVAPGVIYMFNTATNSYDGGTNGGITTQRNNLNTLTVQGVTPSNYAAQVTHPNTGVYTPLSAIAETAGNFTAFVPDIEPFYGVAVYVTTIGSGDLTLTMHDSMNNDLGAVTIPHASIVAGWNLFTFASPGIRAFVNAVASTTLSTGYHFHLTSSVNADTMQINTITTGDITGCNFVLFAYRLVATNNGFHPMANFNQYLCIGNGNYLSTYNYGNDNNPNNSQWVRHQLFLDVGYEITSLANSGQYLVIAAGRRSTVANRQYQGGYLYLWDGINQAPNLKVPVPAGTPYSVFCFNNVVYFFCNGSFYAYAPGSPMVNKIRYIGFQNTNFINLTDATVVNPNMMATRYNVLHMGYPSSTTNVKLNMGIYTWGNVEMIYPNSFGYSYLTADQKQNASGGSGSSAWSLFEIGAIENFVDTMYMSSKYKDHNGTWQYRLDLLDNTCGLAPNFNMTLLMWDGGARYKVKIGARIKVSFTALPNGVSLTPWYSIDRGPQYLADPNNVSYTVNGDGAVTQAFINVPQGTRFHELQVGFIGAVSGTVLTSPAITGFATEIDGLGEEKDLRPDG